MLPCYTGWDELQYIVDLTHLGQVKSIILSGDFNADPSTPKGIKLLSFVNVNAFSLHINEPTRITETTSSILDQFMSNIPKYVYDTGVDPPLLTNDHCTISITLSFKISRMQPIERFIWQYNNADFKALNTALQTTDWSPCFKQANINGACLKWNEMFLNLASQYIPNKVVNVRTNDKPWFNSELTKLLRQKNKAHRRAKRSNSPGDWANFRRERNHYTEKIREAANMYRTKLASNKMKVLVQVPNRGCTLPDSSWGKVKTTVSQQCSVGKKSLWTTTPKPKNLIDHF